MKYLIYVTKAKPYLFKWYNNGKTIYECEVVGNVFENDNLNGHIVAEFVGDAEEIYYNLYYSPRTHYSFKYETKNISMDELLAKSCLTVDGLDNYLTKEEVKHNCGYAIHIENLKVFDKPLKLKEVKTLKNQKAYEKAREQAYEKALEQAYEEDSIIADRIACDIANDDEIDNCVELAESTEWTYGLKKAPQNMCWVWYKGERYCLISIRSPWACKILNGEKTIEIRKKILKGMI